LSQKYNIFNLIINIFFHLAFRQLKLLNGGVSIWLAVV